MTVLEAILDRIEHYYSDFREALRDYRSGKERVYALERLAQLIAQSILDLAAVMASRERGVKPETYRALAHWLSLKARLPRELAEFLEGLAGFRSILVHMYMELDRGLEERAFEE